MKQNFAHCRAVTFLGFRLRLTFPIHR